MERNKYPISFLWIFKSFWLNRYLIWQLTKREVIGRYRGSFLGLLWSFVNPLLMLAVYTFVFGFVFKTRWAQGGTSVCDFSITLFSGLVIFNLFSECVNRAPTLILSNVNYVKKVVFPLEILPWVAMGTTLFHASLSVLVLLIFYLFIHFSLCWTIVFLPIVILPLIFFTMGLAWFLSSFGVYVRDVGQAIGVFTLVMMFLSPIFYPLSSLPESLRRIQFFNPLAFMIEQMRAVVIWGQTPSWLGFCFYLGAGLVTAWLGFAWFQKTRNGFADVI